MNTGKRIKQLRKDNKMTLIELSKLSGVAVATLSRMEANIMTGTLDAYSSICKALGITLSEFFKGLDAETAEVRVKESEVAINKAKYSILSLASKSKGKLKPVLINIKPKFSIPEQKSKIESEKFIYVVDGSIRLNVAGDEHDLGKDNSAYFNSSFKHTIKNISSKEAKILSVEC